MTSWNRLYFLLINNFEGEILGQVKKWDLAVHKSLKHAQASSWWFSQGELQLKLE